MGAIDAYLRQLDDTWAHRWESLRSALDGVTDEEAAWQAPCYADVEPEAGWPAPGTIRWQVAHLAHCKRYYAAVVRERRAPADPEPTPRPSTATFAEDRAALEAAHAEQRAAIEACPEEDLALRVEGGRDLSDFLAATIRHDAWHAGQIAVVRRLWAHRD